MRRRLLFYLFVFLLAGYCAPALHAQQIAPVAVPQQDPRRVDEQLASEFYRNKEWEKALPIYERLYDKYKAYHYYNNYFECLIQLQRYHEAERLARRASRNQNQVQAQVDLAYLKKLQGDADGAKKAFDEIIRNTPADRNLILLTANNFRTRGLDEEALKMYAWGSQLQGVNDGFFMEQASLHLMTGNFAAMMDNYLAWLELNPTQGEMVKSRIQSVTYMDVDNSLTELVREKLLEKAQQHPDKLMFGDLLIWFSLQEKDYGTAMRQAMAMDRRFGELDLRILELSEISRANEATEVALQGYNYLLKKGRTGAHYLDAEIGSLNVRFALASGKPKPDLTELKQISAGVEKVFENEGFNPVTAQLVYTQSSIMAYYLDDASAAMQTLDQALKLPLSQLETAKIKMQKADILLFTGDVWEATLLYSQIDKALKNEPIGHEARFRNARLRYYIGEFAWAQTQLDVLKAATSKLIANDAMQLSLLISDVMADDTTGLSLKAFAEADLWVFRKNTLAATTLLDSLGRHSQSLVLKPHILLKQAELQLIAGEEVQADSLLTLIYSQFPDHYLADDALFRSAQLNESKHPESESVAQKYEWVFTRYPVSVFASRARQKYRLLRGDKLQ